MPEKVLVSIPSKGYSLINDAYWTFSDSVTECEVKGLDFYSQLALLQELHTTPLFWNQSKRCRAETITVHANTPVIKAS